MSLDIHLRLKDRVVYHTNITHNLGEMAEQAGLYSAIWRPYRLNLRYSVPKGDYQAEYKFEEENPVKARDIIEVVKEGLAELKARPDYFRQFNAENGWGKYEQFVEFVEEYLQALRLHPESIVETDR